MNTNKFFNVRRFWNLLRNDLLLNHKRYLFTLAGMIVVVFLFLVWDMTRTSHGYLRSQYTGFFFVLFIGIGAFIGSAFPLLSDKKDTCNYLLLPASVFEKYLVQFLICFVVFIPLALSIFWADAHLARWTASQYYSAQEIAVNIEKFQCAELFHDLDAMSQIVVFMGLFSIMAYLFSARLIFRRFALVKSVILALLLMYLSVCVMVIFSHIFYPEIHGFKVEIKDFNVYGQITNSELWLASIACISWLFFLPFGYFKLKEKQE
ncbi:MAG: hypothetical protein PHS30_02355 [Bacteroidales bacterium]|nr:hypothetical protein [Bacteroidales bacterium]